MNRRAASARTHTARGQSPRAFSLVEMVSVIAIVGVLGAVAVPVLFSTPKARSIAASRHIARDLDYARELASLRGLSVWASFNTSTESYSLVIEPSPGAGWAAAVPLTDPHTGKAMVTSFLSEDWAGVDIVSVSCGGGGDCGFNAAGAPVNAAGSPITSAGQIVLKHGGSVRIEPRSGYVTSSYTNP
jgi:prepilin-type N-terminal cleavage/methylation domain-containing protein